MCGRRVSRSYEAPTKNKSNHDLFAHPFFNTETCNIHHSQKLSQFSKVADRTMAGNIDKLTVLRNREDEVVQLVECLEGNVLPVASLIAELCGYNVIMIQSLAVRGFITDCICVAWPSENEIVKTPISPPKTDGRRLRDNAMRRIARLRSDILAKAVAVKNECSPGIRSDEPKVEPNVTEGGRNNLETDDEFDDGSPGQSADEPVGQAHLDPVIKTLNKDFQKGHEEPQAKKFDDDVADGSNAAGDGGGVIFPELPTDLAFAKRSYAGSACNDHELRRRFNSISTGCANCWKASKKAAKYCIKKGAAMGKRIVVERVNFVSEARTKAKKKKGKGGKGAKADDGDVLADALEVIEVTCKVRWACGRVSNECFFNVKDCIAFKKYLGKFDLELYQRDEGSTDDGGGRESDYSKSGDEDGDEFHQQASEGGMVPCSA